MAEYPIVTASAIDVGYREQDMPKVDSAEVARQLQDIASDLGAIAVRPGGLPLRSIEVALTMTGEGSIGFLGTGAKVSGEASITVTFGAG